MKSIASFLLIPFLISSANANPKICEVSLKFDNSSSFIITKCNDGEFSTTEHKSKSEALTVYTILTQSWSKAWKNLGCNSESCSFQKPEPEVVENLTTGKKLDMKSNTPGRCEESQILEVEKSKDNISKAAITGLGAGAVAGAVAGAGTAAAIGVLAFPFFSTAIALDGGRGFGDIQKGITVFVIGGAAVIGSIAMVGSTATAWMNHQTTDKFANRNLVFFRDVRSDGVGPEIETRAQLILQSLKDKKFYYGREMNFVEQMASRNIAREDILRAMSRMRQFTLPHEMLKIENIRAELKSVGEAYISADSLLECKDPKELYIKISFQTISKLLNKYVK
jgi:hypothetical protein